jgi:hypothetical protein
MQHSDQPFIELERAEAAIAAMRDAGNLNDFEEHWKQYLHRVERVWNKARAHYGRSPKWLGWASKYEQARKSDPLLCYLINARGAEEHSVNEIVGREPGGVGINAAEGTSLHIKRIEQRDGKLVIESDQPLKIDFIAARTTLVPVTNRGRVYPVPSSHLGQQIDPKAVPNLAELATTYYRTALAAAEQFFVK